MSIIHALILLFLWVITSYLAIKNIEEYYHMQKKVKKQNERIGVIFGVLVCLLFRSVISTYLISDFVTPIAKIITNLGGAISLISITIILLVVLKNKKIGIAVMINLLISTVLNIILKNVVQRPRPNEFRLITETGYSFPSGHSMVSMAFYGFLIYLIYKLVKNSKIKWTLIISLSIIICTIGISRIYLGVHYASDVLAGFTISISYLVIYTSIIKRFIGESRKNEENEKDKKQL